MTADASKASRPWAAIGKILCLVLVLVLVNRAVQPLAGWLEMDLTPGSPVPIGIVLTALVYAVTLAIPFVPGAEIGLMLIALMGVDILMVVYGATVAGLCIAFVLGRLVPHTALIRFAYDLRMHRVATLMTDFHATPKEERLQKLAGSHKGRIATLLLRHRYIALGLLINLPGNIVLGGGGGLAMMAGTSRLFAPHWFFLTVLVAVSPVPLVVLLFDAIVPPLP